jgi:transglutaminase-like putative cysteine protease
MQNYLEETKYLNFNHPQFEVFFNKFQPTENKIENAIKLYEYVRDSFLYDPYHLNLRDEALQASAIILKKRAWCVEKAIVLTACFRKAGIPARLGFAIVKNHIGVEKLTHYLRRPEIVFHGFVDVFLEGNWSKCTPAFDTRICNFNKVEVLRWDGETDSLFQEYLHEQKYMTYIHQYGVFDDVPVELMHDEMRKYYPHLFEESFDSKEFSFHYNP